MQQRLTAQKDILNSVCDKITQEKQHFTTNFMSVDVHLNTFSYFFLLIKKYRVKKKHLNTTRRTETMVTLPPLSTAGTILKFY